MSERGDSENLQSSRAMAATRNENVACTSRPSRAKVAISLLLSVLDTAQILYLPVCLSSGVG
jgi:hypothetical protein